jgi:hypothetical protein
MVTPPPGELIPDFAQRPILAGRPFRLYLQARRLPAAPGVLAILGGQRGEWFLLDVAHADNVAIAFRRHDRRTCWQRIWGARAVPAVAFHETTAGAPVRQQIVEAIWRQFPGRPCG